MITAPDPQLEAYVAAVEAAMASTDAALADLRRYVGRQPGREPMDSQSSVPISQADAAAHRKFDDLVTPSVASRRSGRKENTIRKWCKTEGIGVKQGGGWLVSMREVELRKHRRKKD
ncbi:hypothetical protein C1D09_018825 [Mesorhizobium intechi]|uniref:hypothetical protein n=1 Tax=Mesorhizobium intechi TaxID=537601 RepID=UPI000CAE68A2|nr:hypothetical protein [Mesorhizobium intechi]TSE07587.1 hypothetical protein C1D09_018825 [Mesorhizobium intechi]